MKILLDESAPQKLQLLIDGRDGGIFDATLRRETLDMMNGSSERLDRVERILEELARSQEQSQERMTRSQEQFQERMTSSQEQFQERVTKRHEQFQEWVEKNHREMAARQQYHDEAFERHDAAIKAILEAIAVDSENIRALVRNATPRNQRLEGLEGGESA